MSEGNWIDLGPFKAEINPLSEIGAQVFLTNTDEHYGVSVIRPSVEDAERWIRDQSTEGAAAYFAVRFSKYTAERFRTLTEKGELPHGFPPPPPLPPGLIKC